MGVADSYIMLFLFGYIPRDEAVPKAKFAYEQAVKLSPNNSDVVKLSGILNFLDWKWKESQIDFEKSIQINPKIRMLVIGIPYGIPQWVTLKAQWRNPIQ